jgi:hypothetical protein
MNRVLLAALLVCLPACGSGNHTPGASGGVGAGGSWQTAGNGGSVSRGGAGGSVGYGGGGSLGRGGTGGSASTGGTSGQSDPMRTVCEAQCARLERCFPDRLPTAADKAACVPTCITESPSANTFREGVLSSVAACIRNLACDANDDLCLVQAAEQQDPNWIESPDGKACLARYRACGEDGFPVGYSDESCSLFVIFSPSTLVDFNECLAMPCPEVASCVATVIPL